MRNSKRILEVKIKHMIDESPDTSWLGEYSNTQKTEYAIDRAHSEDCIKNQPDVKAKLERIASHVDDICDSEIDEANDTIPESEARFEARNTMEELLSCDCDEHGDMERGEYRYFNGPVENYKGESPEDIRKYVRQDYERMERLNVGDWCFIFIKAEVEIQLIATEENSVVSKVSWHSPVAPYQTITSGGLWGIESDSDKDYIAEIEGEQLSELKSQLTALGFSKRAIATAFKSIKKEGN
jgi:hypothetical protein